MKIEKIMSEQYCLKWNAFQSTVSNSFSILRKEESLFDVILVSDEHVQTSAHKLVLSACSSFFKDILKNTSHPQPVIYLSGVPSTIIGYILDYIYLGEVNLHQEHLDIFLETAQRLKIEGLLSTEKHNTPEIKNEQYDMDDASEDVKSNISFKPPVNERSLKNNPIVRIESQREDELEAKKNEMLVKKSGVYYCNLCGHSGSDSRNMKRHTEIHIEGMAYICTHCGKSFRSRNSFRTHKYTFHK